MAVEEKGGGKGGGVREGKGRRKPNKEAMWMRGERGWRKDGVGESVRASGFVFPPKQKQRKHGENEGISLFLSRLLCLHNHGIKEGYQSLHT